MRARPRRDPPLYSGRPRGRQDGDQRRRAAFSACPDVPSRRASSASTSAGDSPWRASSTRQWNHRSATSRRDARRVAVLRGHDGLGGLLADLLEDRVVALREQRRDVGGRRGRRCGATAIVAASRARMSSRISHRRRSPSGPSARARPSCHAPSSSVRKKHRSWPVWHAMPPSCSTSSTMASPSQSSRISRTRCTWPERLALAPQLVARARQVVRLAACRAVRASASRFIHASVSTLCDVASCAIAGDEAVGVPARLRRAIGSRSLTAAMGVRSSYPARSLMPAPPSRLRLPTVNSP